MRTCVICSGKLWPFLSGIADYEYGVPWTSDLIRCEKCGLINQEPMVSPEEVNKLYPKTYFAHSKHAKSGVYSTVKEGLVRHLAKRVVQHVPQGASLLEVGCGNGSFLQAIHAIRPDIRLHGVDIVDTRIEGIDGLQFWEGQLEQADIPRDMFHLIYSSNLIEHVVDPVEFVDTCTALLKHDGVLYTITPDHRSIDRYVFGRYWAGYHYPRHLYLYDHENIVALHEKSGLEVKRVTGGYSFWYLSFANRFLPNHGLRKRGIVWAIVNAMFLPVDLFINLFRCHGSMSIVAVKP